MRPITTTASHDAMWQWDRRMFAHRHPQSHFEFDLVPIALGRAWWQKFPAQDWKLTDWAGRQVGQVSLCPITEGAYTDLKQGKRKESDLRPDDLIAASEIFAHQFWYLANFMCAKRRSRVPGWIADLARDVMLLSLFERMLKSTQFRTHFRGEVHNITFVEAKSIEKIANRSGFRRCLPGVHDPQLQKIYEIDLNREQLAFQVKKAAARLLVRNLIALAVGIFRGGLFQQPPDFRDLS